MPDKDKKLIPTEFQKVWNDKIRRGARVKDDWMKEFQVEKARKYYEGKQRDGEC